MLSRWLRRAHETRGVGQTLWVYLWWGLLIRSVLLAAMVTLLIVEGNFLAEWLFSWRITPSLYADIEDYTIASYVAFGAFLTIGVYLRWTLLQRLQAAQEEGDAPVSVGPAD